MFIDYQPVGGFLTMEADERIENSIWSLLIVIYEIPTLAKL
jgi:hypothetical protein